jgi:hypothetical protein
MPLFCLLPDQQHCKRCLQLLSKEIIRMMKGSRITLPVVGVRGNCRLGDRALEVFEGVAEICKCGRLVLEAVPQFVEVGEEVSKNISVL